MSKSKIQKSFEVAKVAVDINSTGTTQINKPAGWESSDVALLSALCHTKYGSNVDYTFDNFAYFGELRTSSNPMIFNPKVQGNATRITFLLAKIG